MKDKYYTPTKEEFHIGFEYEEFYDGEYIKCIYKDQKNKLELILNYLKPRVKYLDKDDIEDLGFIYKKEDIFKLPKTFRGLSTGDDKKLFLYHNKTNVCIWFRENRGSEDTLFKGSIKNKSALKVLLKQLNINYV